MTSKLTPRTFRSEPSYPTQSTPERRQTPPAAGRRANPFSEPESQTERYEMEDRNLPPISANANGAGYGDGDLSGFYSEVR